MTDPLTSADSETWDPPVALSGHAGGSFSMDWAELLAVSVGLLAAASLLWRDHE